MGINYNNIKKNELKSIHDEFSFSREVQIASRNDLWRNKTALWKILSAACDDAAKQCYIKINNMVSDIADVDTCNIHSLKSLAKSVDAEFLTKDIREDYDDDILELINLFSVPKEYILNSNIILHESVNDNLFGYLTLKSLSIPEDTVPIDLLYNIKLNGNNLKHVFERNLIPLSRTLEQLIKTDLKDLKTEDLKNSETILTFLSSLSSTDQNTDEGFKLSTINLIKSLTLEKILDVIISFKKDENLKIYENQSLMVKDKNGFEKINYFYLLINIIKQNYYNEKNGTYLNPTYYDKEKNQTVDLTKLIFNIIGSIFNKDKLYLDEYVGYHFFFTILSKISNDAIKSNYIFNKDLKTYVFNTTKQSEMTKEEFIAELTSFISFEEANNFITDNLIIKYRKEFIDFVSCLSKLNKILKYKNKTDKNLIEYNVLKINFPSVFPDNFDDILYGNDGILYFLTKSYIDECINIRKIRENLKNLIQQYTFIGTKRIATDLLYEFFIKNYSKKESVGYFSTDETTRNFEEVKRSISDLLYGSGLNEQNLKGDDKFEINIIEYYDQTKYLNIESDLPYTTIENTIIDYENTLSTYLDENYLITSSYVQKPVYSTSYAPCSLFINDYNEKFWANNLITLNSVSKVAEFNGEDYINFYSSYIPEIKIVSLNTFKTDYIKEDLIPLLNNIWDTFALSSVSNEDLNTDEGILYKEYIGNNLGKNKFINNANSTFPTIAPINSIENLVECKKYDDENLLFLAKNYYSNVISKIKVATKKILNMYNKDGIPCNGWKRSYISFHGYSNYYESSNNKLQYSVKSSEKYKNNGPFVYSKLQDYFYEQYLSGSINLNEFLKEYDLPNAISGIYNYYLNDEEGRKIFFDNDLKISNLNISQYDEDIYENCFTLFKSNSGSGSNITGKLYFRSYTMPISIPIMEEDSTINENEEESSIIKDKYDLLSVSNLKAREYLRSIVNNCIDFGLLNKHLWIFGKCGNVYRLVSFKYDFKNGFIVPNPETITFYKSENDNDENIDYLKTLNDFVGAYYNENEIHLILFDCHTVLKNLSSNYGLQDSYEILNNYNIKFTDVNINTKTSIITYKTLQDYNFNVAIPMFLDHLSYETINGIKFKNNERIWKLLFKDNICYITYKSLSKNIKDDTFNYYFRFNTDVFKIQLMNVNWNSDLDYFNINEDSLKDEMIFELQDEKGVVLLSNEIGSYNKITLFKNQLTNLSKCYFKNARIYSQFCPFNIGFNFTNNFVEFLISLVIKNNITDVTFEAIYNLLFSTELINWINTHKWTIGNKSYDDLKASYKLILNIINNMEETEEITINNIKEAEEDLPLIFTAINNNSTVKLTAVGSPVISGVQYRTNSSSEWESYQIDTIIYLQYKDDYVQFRNISDKLSTDKDNFVQFIMGGKIEASGNIQAMLNGSNTCTSYCYYNLFRNCGALIKAPKLLAIELQNNCYCNMFRNCVSLIKVPDLPATSLANNCYDNMFNGCTSLLLIQKNLLQVKELKPFCYAAMFNGCTSLELAPDLPAELLVTGCYYYMFYNCPSLQNVKVGFNHWNDSINATDCWLTNSSSEGTFIKPLELEKEKGESKIPENWSIIEY